jgi:hypothetical protein
MSLDAASPKAADVDLCDVWEDTTDPSTQFLQSLLPLQNGRRLSKFFYIGMADAVPLLELPDRIGKIGRLGIGVKTKVKIWEHDIEPLDMASLVLSSGKSHSNIWREGSVRKELVVRVSDHFGIAIGIRIC